MFVCTTFKNLNTRFFSFSIFSTLYRISKAAFFFSIWLCSLPTSWLLCVGGFFFKLVNLLRAFYQLCTMFPLVEWSFTWNNGIRMDIFTSLSPRQKYGQRMDVRWTIERFVSVFPFNGGKTKIWWIMSLWRMHYMYIRDTPEYSGKQIHAFINIQTSIYYRDIWPSNRKRKSATHSIQTNEQLNFVYQINI